MTPTTTDDSQGVDTASLSHRIFEEASENEPPDRGPAVMHPAAGPLARARPCGIERAPILRAQIRVEQRQGYQGAVCIPHSLLVRALEIIP